MLNQVNFAGRNKVEEAIKLLQELEPKDGYYLAFSGGKDSCVIKELANMAGVKFDSHYSITTVDPPELIRFIKSYHPDVERIVPEMNMWDLIVETKYPPTRIARYCCKVLKEDGGTGRTVITGIRKAESSKRSKRSEVEFGSKNKTKREKKSQELYKMNDNDERRKFIESCPTKGKWVVNPIIEWTDEDVWEFIKLNNVPYCELYDQGFERLGCIGCPMARKEKQLAEFERYPTFKAHYIRAFQKMVDKRKADGMKCDWNTGEEVMEWWLSGDKKEEDLGELYEQEEWL